jgi:tRNA-dihydrouridine synthase C
VISKGVPALVLAPMDGVTDSVMRELLTRRMPFTYCVTEFVRVSNLLPPEHVFLRSAPELRSASRTRSGVPVGVQILGGDGDLMAESARRAASLGASVVDINFGCPAPTVNRHDGGATLLKFPSRLKEIVSKVRAAVPQEIPVSAKLRLGWEDPTDIYRNAEAVALGGASWITIHGRTKTQGYTPPAYWEPIGEVARSLDIPVVANGEIWTIDDLKRCQEVTGCEHFMLGRGTLADPALVLECATVLGISTSVDASNIDRDFVRWRGLILELIDMSRAAAEADRRTIARVKQWLNYASHRKTVNWFDRVKRTRDSAELVRALTELGDLYGLDSTTLAA